MNYFIICLIILLIPFSYYLGKRGKEGKITRKILKEIMFDIGSNIYSGYKMVFISSIIKHFAQKYNFETKEVRKETYLKEWN